jgi:hypothetical protein
LSVRTPLRVTRMTKLVEQLAQGYRDAGQTTAPPSGLYPKATRQCGTSPMSPAL